MLIISMAKAFSVVTLKDEHLLIMRLGALETAGRLNEIITVDQGEFDQHGKKEEEPH